MRDSVPTLRGARAEGEFWAVDLFVDAALAEQLRRRGRPLRHGSYFERWLLRGTGVAALDSLNARFAADSLTLWSGSSAGDRVNPVLRVVFRYAMNLRAVLAAYQGVPGIRAATPREDVGPRTGHTYRLERASAGWHLRADQGVGDCTAGCTSLGPLAAVRWGGRR